MESPDYLAQYLSVRTLLLGLDLCGTFVFALSGGLAAVRRRFDLFGVLALSFAAANAGGIVRDLLIGAVPPPGLADWRYVAVPVLAGLAAFRWGPQVARLHDGVQLFDAAGLGLFAVSGAQKALAFHLQPIAAILLGMMTGVGGGVVRDVLSAEAPAVLRRDIYAVAALAGASVVVAGHLMHLPSTIVTLAGAALCFALRLTALRLGWQLPVAPAGHP
jgi:uncharacterized membrane protein YeiH